MMKHEYHEGPKAGENFQKLARAVFQAPKVAVPKKQPKAKPTARKSTAANRVRAVALPPSLPPSGTRYPCPCPSIRNRSSACPATCDISRANLSESLSLLCRVARLLNLNTCSSV